MPHVTQGQGSAGDTPGDRLLAILKERGIGKRTIARWLLGDGATADEIRKKLDVVKRQAVPGKPHFRPATAEAYSRVLDLPADYFKSDPPKRVTLTERVRELERDNADLRGRVVRQVAVIRDLEEVIRGLEEELRSERPDHQRSSGDRPRLAPTPPPAERESGS